MESLHVQAHEISVLFTDTQMTVINGVVRWAILNPRDLMGAQVDANLTFEPSQN